MFLNMFLGFYALGLHFLVGGCVRFVIQNGT